MSEGSVRAPHPAPPERTEAERAQIQTEVTGVVNPLMDGWSHLDVEASLRAFHPDASWSGGSDPRTIAETRESWTRNFAQYESMQAAFNPEKIRVLTRDAAVIQGTEDVTLVQSDGSVWRWPNNATLNLLVERFEDGWKITIGGQTWGTAEVTRPEEG